MKGYIYKLTCTILSNAEKSYIEQYDSCRNGYNSTIGGEDTERQLMDLYGNMKKRR